MAQTEQWEYQKEYVTEAQIPLRLNEWGDLGWELVSLTLHKVYGPSMLAENGTFNFSEYMAVFKHSKGSPQPQPQQDVTPKNARPALRKSKRGPS